MKQSTTDALRAQAQQCGISDSDAFRTFYKCLESQNKEYAPDLSSEDKEDNALIMAQRSMIAKAVGDA